MTARQPIYFLSHGGPNACYDTWHPVYPQLNAIGREIVHPKVAPSAIVIFSAHWQSGSGPGTIEVNTSPDPLPLIYDFDGYPSHYYKAKFPYQASKQTSARVMELLVEGGFDAIGVERGLDHGVWVPLKIVFNGLEEKMPPIVQVSLLESENAEQHVALGKAMQKLREENILIIVSGMAVHNLRDLGITMTDPTPLPYTVSFDEALRDAAEHEPPAERKQKMLDLLQRKDVQQAHPTVEHLLPIYIGLGAAGEDKSTRLWTLGEGSLSWAQFRFG
jgi:4,5-DOPA dioxygenase extradiol